MNEAPGFIYIFTEATPDEIEALRSKKATPTFYKVGMAGWGSSKPSASIEPLAKVYAKRRIHRLSRIKVELHRQVHDIVGLRDTTSQEDADEAQGKNIMVDGDITAKFVSPS